MNLESADTLRNTDANHPALKELLPFPLGCAVNPTLINKDGSYTHLLQAEFNSLTAENSFKMNSLRPAVNAFDFEEADRFVHFATTHGKRIHGHTLLWHQQQPEWLSAYSGTELGWEDLLKNHIQTVVGRYRKKITSWDVVNEAFDESGQLRSTPFLTHLGPAYLAKAFKFANQSDPDSLLFYNDFNLESNPIKRKAVIDQLLELRSNGVIIHGIGLQMHLDVNFADVAEMKQALDEISRNNLLVHISELDVAINPDNQTAFDLVSLFLKQAEVMKTVFREYMCIPESQRYGITFWGATDNHSWIPGYFNREDHPLLFNSAFQPKPAYKELTDYFSLTR